MLELLIVISVIILLVSIAVPTIAGFQKQAEMRHSMQTMNTLKVALETYRKDHKDFVPESQFFGPNVMYGGQCLVQALTGYMPTGADGANENAGFRTAKGDPVVYKYINLGDIPHARITIRYRERWVFLDSFKNPILYYKYYKADPNDPRTSDGFQKSHNVDGPDDITDYVEPLLGKSGRPPDYFMCTQGYDQKWYDADDEDSEDDDITSLRQQ